jgi:hypothetical protein
MHACRGGPSERLRRQCVGAEAATKLQGTAMHMHMHTHMHMHMHMHIGHAPRRVEIERA